MQSALSILFLFFLTFVLLKTPQEKKKILHPNKCVSSVQPSKIFSLSQSQTKIVKLIFILTFWGNWVGFYLSGFWCTSIEEEPNIFSVLLHLIHLGLNGVGGRISISSWDQFHLVCGGGWFFIFLADDTGWNKRTAPELAQMVWLPGR